MRTNVTAFTILLLIVYNGLFAQVSVGDNCSNPKPVNDSCSVMPKFPNETTAGFTDNMTYWWNVGYLYGNDVVYAVTVPAGTTYIALSVTSVSKPFYIFYTNTTCNTNYTYNYKYITAPLYNFTFPVSGPGTYYIWVDHNNTTDITYGLSFGLIGGVCTYEYIPDTRGNWGFDDVCTSPQTKNSLEVTWNGVPQKLPLTYTPLNTPGVVCGEVFLKNTTGVQGVKTMQFTFGSDLTNISPTVTSIPGFYNSGTWNATQNGNTITWIFTDAAGLGYGDFNGVHQRCLAYTFCFNMTPVSNNYTTTNIRDTILPDSRGMGFSGYSCSQNCCPSPGSCSGGSSGSGSGGNGGIAIGFSDPGVLPVHLVNFSGQYKSGKNELQWQTASEFNSNIFEVERSVDSEKFIVVGSVPAAGNSTTMRYYNYTDDATETASEVLYYRIKEVDKDSTSQYSSIIAMQQHSSSVRLYPNPAHTTLFVEGEAVVKSIVLTDALGNQLSLPKNPNGEGYDVSSFKPGIYFVQVWYDDTVVTDKVMIE